MSQELTNAGVLVFAAILREEIFEKGKRSNKKKWKWSRKSIGRRDKYGASTNLLRELSYEDPAAYKNIMRMTSDNFNMLLEMVEHIKKNYLWGWQVLVLYI